MSGGFIEEQGEGDHQMVTFMFVGPLPSDRVEQWNNAIMDLKRRFGPNLVGVTTKAQSTSPERLALQKTPHPEGGSGTG
jgi:hypothetical protein